MKKFVKGIPCFGYIGLKMSPLSIEKLKAGIFNDPEIRQPINDTGLVDSMSEGSERSTCFGLVVRNFLAFHKLKTMLNY